MLQFSANLSLLFTELDFIDRFKAARECGFNAVEIQFPYATPAIEIKKQLEQNQLELILFNIDADDLLDNGEGLAAVPEKQHLFLQALNKSREYAEILQPRGINVLPGCCKEAKKYHDYLDTFYNSLSLALETFTPLGIHTFFEAINTLDMPDFIIHNQEQMLGIIDELKHPDLFLQYDIYHMRMMGESIFEFLDLYSDKIGHIQFADLPGRGQPGSGTLNFNEIFQAIDQSDYSGWLGAEYRPTTTTTKSLDWMSDYLSN